MSRLLPPRVPSPLRIGPLRISPLRIGPLRIGPLRINPAAVSIALVGIILITAGPAYAEKQVSVDAQHDVVSVTTTAGSQTPAPDNTTADVLRSKVNHARARVKFRIRLSDLLDTQPIVVAVDVKTKEDRFVLYFVRSATSVSLDLTTAGGDPVRCLGKRKRASTATDVVKFSVPRRCLGKPRWVRAGIGVLNVFETHSLIDDALRAGDLKDSGNLTFTVRLRRD